MFENRQPEHLRGSADFFSKSPYKKRKISIASVKTKPRYVQASQNDKEAVSIYLHKMFLEKGWEKGNNFLGF
ncbi:hypothetical protein A7Q09_00690 [Methylacidiphilum sp. Yel]|nr:hypothetical protein A7Q09_00690 [Methylacidiphilum sp. Yel]